MNENALKNLLEIYKNLYTYKHLLKGAPDITVDLDSLALAEISALLPTIEQQTAAVIAYLLGLKTLPDTDAMLARINQYYQKDDFWRRLLLAYVDVCQAPEDQEPSAEQEQPSAEQEQLTAEQEQPSAEQEQLVAEQKQIALQCKELFDSVEGYIQRRKDIIDRFSKALDTQNFPIDSKRLFTNYLNMAEKDPENAWKLLMMSPAAFAPLKATDTSGKFLFSPTQAQKINKNIARFIRSLKV